MLESYVSNNLTFTDLNLYECGIEDCSPDQSYGPAVRDHYLIHYIFEGNGILSAPNNIYHISKGQGFLICPYKATYYKADSIHPWSYAWVGFNGKKAEEILKSLNITLENPVFTFENFDILKNCFQGMLACKPLKFGRNIRMLGYLYILLSQIFEESKEYNRNYTNENLKELYVRKTKEYITKNFHRKISIGEIALYLGIDRSYLCNLFKSVEHLTPQEYLINFRISKSIELMAIPELSISEISRSVGYDDPFVFSKLFKKTKGLSPKNYRIKV